VRKRLREVRERENIPKLRTSENLCIVFAQYKQYFYNKVI
jgi:hypothetical protein